MSGFSNFGNLFDMGGQYGQARYGADTNFYAERIKGKRENSGGGLLGSIVGAAIGLGGAALGIPAPISGLAGNFIGGALGGNAKSGSTGANAYGQMQPGDAGNNTPNYGFANGLNLSYGSASGNGFNLPQIGNYSTGYGSTTDPLGLYSGLYGGGK
jgi:hypothetical protein